MDRRLHVSVLNRVSGLGTNQQGPIHRRSHRVAARHQGQQGFSAFISKDLDADNPVLTTEPGEELRMLALHGKERMEAIGF